jgi:hypothetical protein
MSGQSGGAMPHSFHYEHFTDEQGLECVVSGNGAAITCNWEAFNAKKESTSP